VRAKLVDDLALAFGVRAQRGRDLAQVVLDDRRHGFFAPFALRKISFTLSVRLSQSSSAAARASRPKAVV
jgi:hypothetical protein